MSSEIKTSIRTDGFCAFEFLAWVREMYDVSLAACEMTGRVRPHPSCCLLRCKWTNGKTIVHINNADQKNNTLRISSFGVAMSDFISHMLVTVWTAMIRSTQNCYQSFLFLGWGMERCLAHIFVAGRLRNGFLQTVF
jgi:hypothetical protein